MDWKRFFEELKKADKTISKTELAEFESWWNSNPKYHEGAIEEILSISPSLQEVFNGIKIANKPSLINAYLNVLVSITSCIVSKNLTLKFGEAEKLICKFFTANPEIFERFFNSSSNSQHMSPTLKMICAGILLNSSTRESIRRNFDWNLLRFALFKRSPKAKECSRTWAIQVYSLILEIEDDPENIEKFILEGEEILGEKLDGNLLTHLMIACLKEPHSVIIYTLEMIEKKIICNPLISLECKKSLFNGPLTIRLMRFQSPFLKSFNRSLTEQELDNIDQALCLLLNPLLTSTKTGFIAYTDSEEDVFSILKLISSFEIPPYVDLIKNTLRKCPNLKEKFREFTNIKNDHTLEEKWFENIMNSPEYVSVKYEDSAECVFKSGVLTLASQEVILNPKQSVLEWLNNPRSEFSSEYDFLIRNLIKDGTIASSELVGPVTTAYNHSKGGALLLHALTLSECSLSLEGRRKESSLPFSSALSCSLNLLLTTANNLLTVCESETVVIKSEEPEIENEIKENDIKEEKVNVKTTEIKKKELWKIFDKKSYKLWRQIFSEISNLILKLKESRKNFKIDEEIVQNFVLKGVRVGAPRGELGVVKSVVDLIRWILPSTEGLLIPSLEVISTSLPLVATGNRDKVKEELASLLLELLREFPGALINIKPQLILKSYQATCSLADQTLLQVIHMLDSRPEDFPFDPLVFGPATDSLFIDGIFREPKKPFFIIKLFYENKLIDTCLKYDRSMSHQPGVLTKIDSEIYDPRFLLPCYAYAAEKYQAQKSNPDAWLRLVLVATSLLAAEDYFLRSLAGKILLLAEKNPPASASKGDDSDLLWVWLVRIIRNTLYETAAYEARHAAEQGSRVEQGFEELAPLPGPITRFLQEAILSLKIGDGSDPLNRVLSNFLFLFPSMRPGQIPEQVRLYHDSGKESHGHARLLLLRMVSEGVHTSSDCSMVCRNGLPDLIFSLITSETVTPWMQIQCLKALQKVASIPVGCRHLLAGALLQMLPYAISKWKVQFGQPVLHAEVDDPYTYIASVQQRAAGVCLDLICTIWETLFALTKEEIKVENINVLPENGNLLPENESVLPENGDVLPENEQEYVPEEEEYYDEYMEDEDEEEMKAKARKKRKLEAKQRKASKKAKLESAALETVVENGNTATENGDTVVKKNTFKIQADTIADIAGSTISIGHIANESNDADILAKLEHLIDSMEGYLKGEKFQSDMKNVAELFLQNVRKIVTKNKS